MKAKHIFLASALLLSLYSNATITLEECIEKANANYPEIRKYDLLKATREISLEEINKGWLPRIGLYAQATAQNIVPSFPEQLNGVLEQMGQNVQGLGKLQYKAGVDISQKIWDGGESSARRETVRLNELSQRAALDVDMYSVRERIENIYFAILLTEEQIAQSLVTLELINKNLDKLKAMHRNGTAMQSDIDMLEAQALSINQKINEAKSAAEGYRRVLGLFIGEDIYGQDLSLPSADMPLSDDPERPELKLFERKIASNLAAKRLSDKSIMPRIGFFAQAYYGYPGFDYFSSMMNRNLSFNIIAGVKISWNIDSFYTRRLNSSRADLNTENIIYDRELFLFNTRLKSASQKESIKGMRSVIKDDARIIALRANVRKAAESQLENGVIDATALLVKISDENTALLNSKFHEIQLLQEIYKLKYTLNR